MVQTEELLAARVREDAENLSRLAHQGLNAPLDRYLDTTSLNSLCVSLRLEASEWHIDDLERILIIRDGLYDLRNRLRDVGDQGEHSVEQVLGGLDRLYADLERALRAIGKDQLSEAQRHLARGREGSQVASSHAPAAVEALKKEATELLTQTFISHRRVELNIIKIDSANVELFRDAKLIIERLSASVFAIRLSLEQSVVLKGTFTLLSEGADRVLAKLRELVEQIGTAYGTVKEFLADWGNLADKGDRFTRMVGRFLTTLFGDEPRRERLVELRVIASQQGAVLLCGHTTARGPIILGGRDGQLITLDGSTGRSMDNRRVGNEAINSIIEFGDLLALGTDDGIALAPVLGGGGVIQAPFRERVTALAAPSWGAKGSLGALVSGTRDGALRRWTMAARFSEEAQAHARRPISRIVSFKNDLLVAAGAEVLFVNDQLDIKRRVRAEQPIEDMALIDDDTLAVCGLGTIATVNLSQGAFVRLVISASDQKYTSVLPMADGCICVGTETGKLFAIDLNSGAEIGVLDVGFAVRGILRSASEQRMVVFGGSWNGRGKNFALITWQANEFTVLSSQQKSPPPPSTG